MKKILYVVESMSTGIFTYIVELANELVDNYEVYIAHSLRPETPPDYRDYFDGRIKLIRVKDFCRSINPMKDLRAFWEIREIAGAIKPDIVHLHSSKAGALGRLAINGNKCLLFYTPHGYSFLMENCSLTKRLAYKLIESILGKKKCVTVCCSRGEYGESIKLTKYAAYVNNGIDTDGLQKLVDDAEAKGHPFTVFTLGRICHQKNPELFNRIAEALPDVKFLWIGDGELRGTLASPNIEVTGWLGRERAVQCAVNGDVFMLASLWEGLPISLLEAMYMRKPCIVSDVIGNRDVISAGRNGFVCADIVDYVNAIRKCRDGEVDRLVQAAYMDVLKEHDTKAMAGKYSEIYEGGGIRN